MKKILTAIGLVVVLTQCVRQSGTQTSVQQKDSKKSGALARRTEILFLGDNGHHKPIERVPEIMEALGKKGINFTYTDKLEDLNADNLNKYDGLLIFANWDSIGKPQEKALLDYVASGHGLIPVHCASYCFRNSAEYVDKVVGGQFWRHRMDTIQTHFTQPNNPIVAGLPSFKAFDETYLHSHLQTDNNVLAVRDIKADQEKDMAAANRPGVKEEPYTWTRQYGKGRVFYTAYGHDERTWTQPGFHQLIERGILWAIGDEAKKRHDALNPQSFAYHEALLPNYEKRPGAQMEQEPLSPEESMKHLQVPVDFTLDLFAHEPNVMHPIALAWDERGRLYALITKDYPNERKPEGGSDYIVICEDTDKDGKADKFTNFAEGLSIPTGMVFANGGLYVSQAPHMLFLQDTNGDDKADVKKIVFSGFGTFDTHAGPSNLHYGFDNWIWGSVGYSGFKGKIGADSVKFSQGFFRFKPDGSKLEHVTNTSNNTWGLGFSETGDIFGSTANNSHGWYMAIPNRYFNGAPHLRENGSRSTDTHKDMKPITEKVRQVDVFGGFTAAAGHNLYTARAFPKKYWNKIAFVAEPTGHILHQNVMEKTGTNYEDAEGFNLIAGADEWFAPVFAEVGPDGAVWVVDWYSYIIQHNPTPKGATNGSGNAYETPLRDFTHGRIYRVGYKNAPAYTPMALSKDRPAELVAGLKNTNMFWRMTAQRLLIERGNKDVMPQLVALVNDQSVDEIGSNPAAIHALWTLHGLMIKEAESSEIKDRIDFMSAIETALKHPAPAVRKTAVQVMPMTPHTIALFRKYDILNDKEPLVVLNALLAFSSKDWVRSKEAQQMILARLDKSTETNDRWLPDAFASALTSANGFLLKTYLNQVAINGSAKSNVASTSHDMSGHAGHETSAMASSKAVVPAGNQPDLVVAAVRTTPDSPTVREGAKLFVDVTNAGGVAIPEGTPIPMTLRVEGPKGVADASKIDFVSVTHNTGIKPGETVTISKANNGPWVGDMGVMFERAGQYTITVMLDRENKIAESNEQNNNATHTLTYRAPQSMSAYVLERATRSYASVAPVDSVVALLRQTQKLNPAESEAIVKGVSEGWNMKEKGQVREADKSFLASLSNTVSTDNRERLNRLYEAWGLTKVEAVDPNVELVRMKTVREEMRFDKKEFTVTAGKQVEIVLENPDAMQHNLVIGKPKSMEIIGAAADKMITAKDGAEKNYVPSIAQIIVSTPLVNPDQTYRLKFTAPATPGDYPYVCTFPGHWRIMNGVMKVVSAQSASVSK
ncbi:PVC-type heme-binding CxxCH protein [Spirosoma endophyticum]|uniref:Putative membrane-bound dehydrogenase domain-containing protein n=1 Tax=Spirosoma endophyticum TaxID=662367 RepID=A0A1I1WAZ4_9BACT|nr:PVC-type heme-binding CxxCH protein [Spirosoma endophyticum]SFD90210.1 putative membrane-bound dehydrogenase domain-containing protein [Spirosoma endophyticum]